MNQANHKPLTLSAKRRMKQLFKAALICAAVVIISIGFTAKSTFDDMWNQQGQYYDTKFEHFVFHYANNTKKRYMANGQSRWSGGAVNGLIDWSYHAMLEHIPDDAFERVGLYYHYTLRDKMRGTKAQRLEAMNEIITIFKRLPDYSFKGYATKHFERSYYLSLFAAFYTTEGQALDAALYHQYNPLILDGLYDAVIALDPEKVKQFDLSDFTTNFFYSIINPYQIFKANIFGQPCNLINAMRWIEISDLYRKHFIGNAENIRFFC